MANGHRTLQGVDVRSKVNPRGERGGALVASLIFVAVLVIGAAAFLSHTSTEVLQVRSSIASARAFYYAEAGLNYAQSQLLRGWKLSSPLTPFHFIDNSTITTLPAEMMVRAGTPDEGEFRAEIVNVSSPYAGARNVTVKSVGRFAGEARAVAATFCFEVKPGRVFNYGYFLGHCGWLEGMPATFKMYGNLRVSGHLSLFNSSAYLNGNPEYKWLRGQIQRKDSGGIYAGLSILDATFLNGMGALPVNQHMNEDLNRNWLLEANEDHNQDGSLTRPERLPMPNLGQMELYEEYSKSWNNGLGGSIKIEGAGQGGASLLVSDAVYGDSAGETGNLVLWGTEQNPILVDGPVAVRGALIIKGYLKGKGAVYIGQNAYIPDNLMYVNPPAGRPNWNYSDYATEEERYRTWMQAASQWRQENAAKDGIGLLARGSVVVGDFENITWRSEVESWLNNPANESSEAANGLDHIPNTNDLGENDGAWTVDRYTQEDLDNGLIPSGKSVGEIIPGSGEDVDGDAAEDFRLSLSDFDLPAAIDTTNWGGWTPLGNYGGGDGPGKGGGKGKGRGKGQGPSGEGSWPTSYADFFNPNGGDALDHIDGFIYSGHAAAANWGRYSPQVHLLGGIASRIEAIIFRNDGSAEWIHDERFTGGGEEYGFILPRVKTPIQIVHWAEVAAQ